MASIRVYLLEGAETFRALLSGLVDVVVLESVEQLHEYDECGVLLVHLDSQVESISDLQNVVAKHSHCVLTVAVSSKLEPSTMIDVIRSGCLTLLPHNVTAKRLQTVCETAWQLVVEHSNVDRVLSRTVALLSSLDSRERQVLQSIMEGLTNREIAEQLGAGRRSVDRWRAAVLEKIGGATTVELITRIARVDEYMRQGGWLPRLVARITQQRLANLLPPILNSREEIPV